MKNSQQNKFSQSGMTLVEILIAIVIGMILIAGVMQVYLSNKQSSRSQDALAYVNNNARFAFNILQKTVSMAGFKANPADSTFTAFPAEAAAVGCPAFSIGEYIINNTADTAGNTDLFCLRMQSPLMGMANTAASDMAELFDCTATSTDTDSSNRTFTTRFFINNNTLMCQTSIAGVSVPLIDDIVVANRATDLLYGVDTDNDKVANKYINGPSVTASEWRTVVGVRLTLTAQSSDAIHGNVTANAATTQMTKTYTQTLTLRSRTN